LPQARSDNQLVYTSINQLCYAGSNNTAACTSPPSGSLPYTYDAGDNLTKMGAAFQTFNNADQLCWTGSTSGTCSSPPSGVTRYAYDTRGNRVTVTPPGGGPTTLAYDQANRLVGYGATATYAYNGDGLRMSKTISGSTTQFLWDVAGPLPLLLKDGFVQYVYGAGGSQWSRSAARPCSGYSTTSWAARGLSPMAPDRARRPTALIRTET
jgi:YD repeat-containing protein